MELGSYFRLGSRPPNLELGGQVHPAQQDDPEDEESQDANTQDNMKVSPSPRLLFRPFTRATYGEVIQLGGGTARHRRDHGGVAVGIAKRMLTYDGDGGHLGAPSTGRIIIVRVFIVASATPIVGPSSEGLVGGA